MKKHTLGVIITVLGVLFLALQIYCLPLIQAADMTVDHGCYPNIFMYLVTMPGIIATLITLAVIVHGVYLVVEYREKDRKDSE